MAWGGSFTRRQWDTNKVLVPSSGGRVSRPTGENPHSKLSLQELVFRLARCFFLYVFPYTIFALIKMAKFSLGCNYCHKICTYIEGIF